MLKKILSVLFAVLLHSVLFSQGNLNIEKISASILKTSGTIIGDNRIRGYYFLYQTDKISKQINQYTLQVFDQNVNKVIDIKFEETRRLNVLEASYNNTCLAFLFCNEDKKTYDLKIYSSTGILKYSYSRNYIKGRNELPMNSSSKHPEQASNKNLFNLGQHGFASVYPVLKGRNKSYLVEFYSSLSESKWTYTPENNQQISNAQLLGNTDSIMMLKVLEKNSAGNTISSRIIGLDFVVRKKAFEIGGEQDGISLNHSSILPVQQSKNILLLANYYQKNEKMEMATSSGLAILEIDMRGNILSRVYNSWEKDLSAFIPKDHHSKVKSIGYLTIHGLTQGVNGKMLMIGESYNTSNAKRNKIAATNIFFMEFNDRFKLINATVFDKTNQSVISQSGNDYITRQPVASDVISKESFDQAFARYEADYSTFSVSYSDKVKSEEYKGDIYHSIRFNGEKFVTDRIELKTRGSRIKVYPAKPGCVMIVEYFKKSKRIDLRLEKLG